MIDHFAISATLPSVTRWGQAVNSGPTLPVIVGDSSALTTSDDGTSRVIWAGGPSFTTPPVVEVRFGAIDLSSVENLQVHLVSRGATNAGIAWDYAANEFDPTLAPTVPGQAEVGFSICDGNGEPYFTVAPFRDRTLGKQFANDPNRRRLQVYSPDGAYKDSWLIWGDPNRSPTALDFFYPETPNPAFDGTTGVYLYLVYGGHYGAFTWYEFSSETTQVYLKTDVLPLDLRPPALLPFMGLSGLFNTVTLVNSSGAIVGTSTDMIELDAGSPDGDGGCGMFFTADGNLQELGNAGFQRWDGARTFGATIPIQQDEYGFKEAASYADWIPNYENGTLLVSGFNDNLDSSDPNFFKVWEVTAGGLAVRGHSVNFTFRLNCGGVANSIYYSLSGTSIQTFSLLTGELDTFDLDLTSGFSPHYVYPWRDGFLYAVGSTNSLMAMARYTTAGALVGVQKFRSSVWDQFTFRPSNPMAPGPDGSLYWYTEMESSANRLANTEGIWRAVPTGLEFDGSIVPLDPFVVMPSTALNYNFGWIPFFQVGAPNLNGTPQRVMVSFDP